MLDFNAKKAVLRRLRAKRDKNKALWLPCVIAELCVKLWYTLLTGLDLALSDKNGKLFGFISTEKQKKTRRQDDIVYVKKPFLGRMLSAVLAASLALMFMPEIIPEMDIGVTASAALSSAIPVEVINDDGITTRTEYFYQDTGDRTKLYPKEEYDKAIAYTADITTLYESNGCICISWAAASSVPREKIKGYQVFVTDDTGTTRVDEYYPKNRATSVTDEVIKLDNKRAYFEVAIYPVTTVSTWTYTPADPNDPASVAIATPPTNSSTNTEVKSENANYRKTNRLNAELPKPVLDDLPDITENVNNNPAAKITWNKVAYNGNDAYAYRVFRQEAGKAWEDKGAVLGTTEVGGVLTFYDNTIKPGTHYYYFVEAYDFAWGGSTYNINDPGMITSSGGSTKESAETKANSVYGYGMGGYIKDFYVSPARPSITPLADEKKHLINVSWKFNDNADGILLVRSERQIQDEEWNTSYHSITEYLVSLANGNNVAGLKFLGDPASSVKSYDDSDIVASKDYWYYGIAYLNKGSERLYSDPERKSSNMDFGLEPPQNLKTASSDGQIELSWDAVKDADGYILTITKLTDKNGNAVSEAPLVIGNIKATKYTHDSFKGNDLLNGEKYQYTIQAYANVKTPTADVLKSDPCYPRTATVGVLLDTPQDLKAETKDGTVDIKWSAVKGAEGYLLHYKYQKKNGSSSEYTASTVFDVAKTSYTHSGLNNGDKFYYRVEAYKTVSGERVKSPLSDEVWVIVGVPLDAPKDFEGKSSDGKVELKWSAVKGAEGYIVHIIGSNGTKQDIDVSKTSYTHIGVKNGETYTYYVQAYKTVNGERVYSDDSASSANRITLTVGDYLEAPKDFDATTTDGVVNLSWTASKGAEGYILYAYGPGQSLQFDLSKTKYDHIGLTNGDQWTYYAVAYKTINGTKCYSEPTASKTITVGVSINAPMDLTATAGNRQIDLSWSAVKGAEGYVVYLYNQNTMEFEPITVVSGTKYSHIGLKNGKKYTYMLAPFKTINGTRYFGDYSMSVSAIPTTGSVTDIDHSLNVKGTTPYGISHSEYISANANHGAFDESVDVYFTTNRESTNEVKDVLKHYANGLKSFIIYPFDISVYQENTRIHVKPNDGYTVTVTMPIPDRLIAYRDYLTVVHIGEETTTNSEANNEILDPSTALVEDWIKTPDSRLQVLPCAVLDIDNVWCIQFVCTEFSPYALVIYKDHLDNVASGGGVIDGSFAGTFNSGILLFTTLPDILPHNKRLKVVAKSKRYRIVKKD